jgi:hypothetical protein
VRSSTQRTSSDTSTRPSSCLVAPTLSTIASALATTSLKNVLHHRSWNEKAELEDAQLEGPELTIRLAALTQRHNLLLNCTSATAAVRKECKELGYYYTSARVVQALYRRFLSWDAHCECRILYAN